MILQNKVTIVTGGGRGIGKAIALRIAAEGANMILLSRSPEQLRETEMEMRSHGFSVQVFAIDIGRHNSVQEAVQRILDDYGTIDILINNAGIQGPIGQLVESDIEQWIQTIHTNLIGTYLCSRLVLPTMMKHRSGKIINLAGGGATAPRKNFSAYASSKTAIVRFTETLAEEVREFGICVNAISPGAINTKMTEEVLEAGGRAGKAEFHEAQERLRNGGNSPNAAAELALFLSCNESDGITGKLISAIWDPWREKTFQDLLRSDRDIAALRRIDDKTFYKKI